MEDIFRKLPSRGNPLEENQILKWALICNLLKGEMQIIPKLFRPPKRMFPIPGYV